jgi:hypothetical protein
MAPKELVPDTPCPGADTIASFEAGELDEETAQSVRQHTIFCKDCLEELYLLRQAAESAGKMKKMKTSVTSVAGMTQAQWRKFLKKAKEFVIDLGTAYGSDSFVGLVRILQERPEVDLLCQVEFLKQEYAETGLPPMPPTHSKVLEIPVGENAYRVELGATPRGFLVCHIAGLRTPLKRSLGVAVRSETGEELISTQADESGKSHFVIPSAPDGLLVLILNLEGSEQQVVFRIPQRQELP